MGSNLLLAGAVVLALAAAGCDQSDMSNGAAPVQPAEAAEKAGNQTIADALDKNGRFYQAAHAAGLDATLAGPGPYTVLVPKDESFAKIDGSLKESANPQNRAELTRILTYHILPGTVLIEDLAKAVETGKGKALVQTMNGQTLTASKEGNKVVLADPAGGKATILNGDQQRSNGVVQYVDALLVPSADKASDKK